jgi:tetratricopeptide (TPR) repeat protein
MYWFSNYDDVLTDYDRAEELYRKALELDFDDKDAVQNRLDDLADERAAGDQDREHRFPHPNRFTGR